MNTKNMSLLFNYMNTTEYSHIAHGDFIDTSETESGIFVVKSTYHGKNRPLSKGQISTSWFITLLHLFAEFECFYLLQTFVEYIKIQILAEGKRAGLFFVLVLFIL